MKNKLTFLVVLAFSLSIKAQIYTPSGTVQGTSSNDNVGIGTSSPTAKLTIQAGPNNYPSPLKAISILGPNSPTNSNSAQTISWDFASAGSATISSFRGNQWDTYMQFSTNSILGGNNPQVRMHINEDGNVGIGTLNPTQKLDVNGNGVFNGSITASFSNDVGGNIQLINPSKNGNGIASKWAIYNTTGEYGNSLQFWAYDNLGCGGGMCNNRFAIMDNGNVGIGTINPDAKLAVNGTIHSKEVRVDLNIPAPDYVFANDYKLRTLPEVETYVKENSHLPEIPSAQEFEKSGIQLAEMNMALLKKVEELTLYAIEQQKNTEMLTKIIAEQNKRLEALENGNKN